MGRKISMQQLADRLGVSKYTVSQALAGKPGVSEATRREVLALAAALGYTVRTNSSKTLSYDEAVAEAVVESESATEDVHESQPPVIYIGLDIRHEKEPYFWLRVKEGVEAGCRMHGFQPEFFTFGQDELTIWTGATAVAVADAPDRLSTRAAGFIIAGKCPLGTLLTINRFGLPIVLVDHEEPMIGADAVLHANTEAGRMACHHLLSQGCRSLVFIGRDSFAVSFKERWWGCRLAMDEGKAAARSESFQLKKWTVPYGGSEAPMSRGWEPALERRLDAAVSQQELPEGFICANDDIALHLLLLLSQHGLQSQVRVVGIDNTAPSLSAVVPLTTVDLAKEWLGIRAVEAFARKLKHPSALPEKIILRAQLVVRESG
ncbi:DNA-binding LacI/PurR family transcriptional regulator [Paenibacillus taihuensis]|uniref:DNA-binding LacI/PurR family transcriptional regulator n=1 Tax=Paenibacillus taihuensis TaxID=1156355 RepID=A0A3D9SE21_9BACL|nr:LacI family DNA-binding transcriptional regulator [Paenibacillus taihuensis]REE93116.1 DNA-binding LacI/PurR family transcriptional regulator [Paenibacillus taihuensis]